MPESAFFAPFHRFYKERFSKTHRLTGYYIKPPDGLLVVFPDFGQ